MIDNVKNGTNLADVTKLPVHIGLLQQWAKDLQSTGLSPSRVHGLIKEARTFYRRNGVKIELEEKLSRKAQYKDQVRQPEQLVILFDKAELREKVILVLAGPAGFREETISKLQYRHVRQDLEPGRIPLHIHVEAEIVKGKYADQSVMSALTGI